MTSERWHRMWFPTDRYHLSEVIGLQAIQRHEQTGPATLPACQELCPISEGVHEFVISVTPRFFAVRRQEVGPAGKQIPGDVLHDDGNGVRVLVESDAGLVIR